MKTFFLLPILLMSGMAWASVLKTNISDAIKNHLVKVSAVNTVGGYTGRAVRLTVTNLKKDSLDITVNIGVILKPDESSYQPMVLAGEEKLALAPGKKDEVDVEVFCGNSPRHCPAKNARYTYWRVGSDTLIRVARFIRDHSLFDFLGQSAIWTITNGHAVGSVYDPHRDSLSKKLIDLICTATGRPQPDYYVLTAKNENPGSAAYTPKTLKIIAQFDITLKTPAILSIEAFDMHGHMLEKIVDRKLFQRGKHRLDATFDAEAFSAGTYFIRLMNSEGVLREKKVEAAE